MPSLNDYNKISSFLKLLKPILDNIVDTKVSSDKDLCMNCDELDFTVNLAREFMENWSPKMSKFCCLLQSEQLFLKMRDSSLNICYMLCKLSESLPSTSSSTEIRRCIDELQRLELDAVLEHIEDALKSQRSGEIPQTETLLKIIDSLSLKTSQELLEECIALEKAREKAETRKLNNTIDLIDHIRDCTVKLESFRDINGISVPRYFRCPLSLQLMADPVIVATGQTYERSSIQKWLDQGLVTCPGTHQILSHTILIPNYTVKAMIANWCIENKLELFNDEKQRSGNSEKLDNSSSPEQSYVHSRSESASSTLSSVDYFPSESTDKPAGQPNPNESPTSERNLGHLPWLSGKQYHSSNYLPEMSSSAASTAAAGNRNYTRANSFPTNPGSNELTTTSHVQQLVNNLNTGSDKAQTEAAAELRYLAKHNNENRIIIGQCEAIGPLISLLKSDSKETQEHAVTALLNLSIDERIKAIIGESGALDPLIHTLKTGNSVAKENAAASLFSLSVLEEYRVKIGRSEAVKALVDLLGFGTLRGKKDAATALFNLSIFHDNKARIVQAGAVKYLVELMNPESEMVDKAVALLANLATVNEGCLEIARQGGIPSLVEVVETGSRRGKENAASVLLQLCIGSPKFCRLVLQEGAVPPLVALSQSGSPRAKEKAHQLLSHFRNQREGAMGRKKS
jgi:HEAT repeat protein